MFSFKWSNHFTIFHFFIISHFFYYLPAYVFLLQLLQATGFMCSCILIQPSCLNTISKVKRATCTSCPIDTDICLHFIFWHISSLLALYQLANSINVARTPSSTIWKSTSPVATTAGKVVKARTKAFIQESLAMVSAMITVPWYAFAYTKASSLNPLGKGSRYYRYSYKIIGYKACHYGEGSDSNEHHNWNSSKQLLKDSVRWLIHCCTD